MGHSVGGLHTVRWIANFLILFGIAIIVLDLFTILFLAPIGAALIVWGILQLLGVSFIISGIFSTLVLVIGYYLYVRFAQSVKQTSEFGAAALVGKEGIIHDIQGSDSFIVEVDFELWVAVPAKGFEDYEWKLGDKVVVEKVDGVKLIVRPLEN